MSSENTLNSALNTLKVDKAPLVQSLRENVLSITFTKKDGTERVMKCTLRPDYVIPHEKKTDRVREVADHIIPVWDIEAQGWRSVNVDTITAVEGTLDAISY